MDGVLGGVRLGSRCDLVSNGSVVSLVSQIRGRIVSHHTLIIFVRTLSGFFLLVLVVIAGMSVRSSRIVGVDLRWGFEQGASLEMCRLEAVKGRRSQLADEIIKVEVGRQVLGARWRWRGRRDWVGGRRRRQR